MKEVEHSITLISIINQAQDQWIKKIDPEAE